MFLKIVNTVRENVAIANKKCNHVSCLQKCEFSHDPILEMLPITVPITVIQFLLSNPKGFPAEFSGTIPSTIRSHSCWAHFTSQIWLGILQPNQVT